MRKISAKMATYLLLAFVIGCCGCSGGSDSGGGNAIQGVTYTGLVTQAAITADNQQVVYSSILGDASPMLSPPVLAKNIVGTTGPPLSVQRIDSLGRLILKLTARPSKVSKTLAASVSTTSPGAASGNVTYSGSVNTDGTGSLNFVFTNYNEGDGYTYDGTGTLTVSSYDTSRQLATDAIVVISALRTRTAASSYTMSGTIKKIKDAVNVTEISMFNLCVRNDIINQTFKLENYSISRTYDTWYSPSQYTEMNSGRFYLGAYGFVDVMQTSPFTYRHNNQFNMELPGSGGTVLITGSGGTKMKLTAISSTRLRVEVDTNGDDTFDITTTVTRIDLSGFVFKFEKAIGTNAYDRGQSVCPTSDGGYIVTGVTNSNGNEAPDVYLVKTDATGEMEWEKTFGGPKGQVGTEVLGTSDKGFIIAGYTYPTGYSYAFGYGGEEIYLVRTDADGNLLWEKKFSGSSQWAYSIKNTADGGFIIMGGMTPDFGLSHIYLLKISASGEKQWDRMLGTGREVGKSITVAADGGYVVAGYSSATGYDSIYLIKTDASGNPVWEKAIRKTYNARALSVLTTASGHLIVTGVDSNAGYAGSIDASGNILWEKSFQDVSDIASATETADGSLVFAANGLNIDGVYLIKTDANGSQQWKNSTHGITYSYWPYVYTIKLANDGGYVLTGYIDATRGVSSIQNDIYLVKTDKDGNSR